MNKVEPRVEYKVLYKLNPAYKGNFQRGNLVVPGIQGVFGEEDGGLAAAQTSAEQCKQYFNTDSKAIEKQGPTGKKIVEIKTKIHDNVIVWIEKYIDGFPTQEKIESCHEKSEPESPPVVEYEEDLDEEELEAMTAPSKAR